MAVLRDSNSGREYPLSGPSVVVGRAVTCDVILPEARVSSRNARVEQSGGGWHVTDLGSSNGTRVNGMRVEGRTRLRSGDWIDLCGASLVFIDDPSTAPAFSLKDTVPGGIEPAVLKTLEVAGETRTQVSPEAKLRAVLEISRNLAGTLNLAEVLPKILESLFVVFPQTDRGFILLREIPGGPVVPKAVRHRSPADGQRLAISRTIVERVMQSGQAILSADAEQDSRFDRSESIRDMQIRSIICVPMVDQSGASLGVIQLDTKGAKNQFRQEDLDVLASASLQAARAIELARLHESRRDLEAATEIQRSFLPDERPQIPGLTFFDHYASAQHIGGDYYDYIPLPGNRLAVALGDVAGKGVSAALLMARLSVTVRFCLASERNLALAVDRINATMIRTCGDGRFVTFVVGVIDLTAFEMTWVNAGHVPPLLRRPSGELIAIGESAAGIPLGVFDRQYEATTLPFQPGDAVLLCTDGIIEAKNAAKEMYGLERLKTLFAKSGDNVESTGAAILADVSQFAAGHPAHDDVTMVCFGRAAQS